MTGELNTEAANDDPVVVTEDCHMEDTSDGGSEVMTLGVAGGLAVGLPVVVCFSDIEHFRVAGLAVVVGEPVADEVGLEEAGNSVPGVAGRLDMLLELAES